LLERLARLVMRRHWLVVAIWVVLTVIGAISAVRVSDRWLEDFSIPGYSAYEANQRTLQALGNGEIPPYILVLSADGDVTTTPGVQEAIEAASAQNPGSRLSSFFNTRSDAYVSPDGHTMFAALYPAGQANFDGPATLDQTREALADAAPAGVTTHLTGVDALYTESSGGESGGPSVLAETLVAALGALVILLFTFGTLPAVAMPLVVALASILNTFTLIYLLTYITDVSIVVQFLVALVGLGVAIDYALLMIFRYREELKTGDREEAVVTTMRHAGRSVIVSGSTVAIGLLSMIILPLPFIRSIGIGGVLIPAVSVIVAITLLPALLYMLGPRVNSLRVLPKRMVSDVDPERGFWGRWGRRVARRPWPVAIVGIVIVGVLVFFGLQINPSDAQAKDLPGAGDAHTGYQVLTDAGISPGVLKPFQIVVEDSPTPQQLEALADEVSPVEGVAGASAPPTARADGLALVEAFSAYDGSADETDAVIDRLKDDVLPAQAASFPQDTTLTLAGLPPEEREFIDAVYGTFPYVLAFVVILTFILLMRAFRSVFLPLKAVILNLISLAAAYGVIVLIFQMGFGAEEIWDVPATDSIISWIPLMIFAFLYGLSMDYEVFMISRMREAYDETGSTEKAVALGLGRTGKLVTSAALVLMFAFLVLSSSPGTDIKQFGIGLAAGIILDATVIRAFLVPAIVRVMGRWNWWLPERAAKVLRVPPARLAPSSD
jgi:RND superfamily putative drug exporter